MLHSGKNRHVGKLLPLCSVNYLVYDTVKYRNGQKYEPMVSASAACLVGHVFCKYCPPIATFEVAEFHSTFKEKKMIFLN